MPSNLYTLVGEWTKGKIPGGFCFDSGYYAGRPPSTSDINTAVLEGFYDGLKKKAGEEAAANFVRFVNALQDMSASSFIVAFEAFFRSGCKVIDIKQRKSDRTRITEHGGAAESQAFAVMANALAGRHRSEEEICELSIRVKQEFITKHRKEIPPLERTMEQRW